MGKAEAAKPPHPRETPGLKLEYLPLAKLRAAKRNPKRHSLEEIHGSMARFGYTEPIVLDERTGRLVAGHGRLETLRADEKSSAARPQNIRLGAKGRWEVPVIRGWASKNDEEAEAYLLASNQIGAVGGWDSGALAEILHDLNAGEGLLGTGFTSGDIIDHDRGSGVIAPNLAEKFLVPPFSVLDARQGYWQERKRAWLSMGIESEVGRGENLLQFSETVKMKRRPKAGDTGRLTFATGSARRDDVSTRIVDSGGTSIFDPVLCELVYRWFAPPSAKILDPFAGGSVRGIVAGKLGHEYVGIDLRPEQTEANERQADRLFAKPSGILGTRLSDVIPAGDLKADMRAAVQAMKRAPGLVIPASLPSSAFYSAGARGEKMMLTPVEEVAPGILLKRDDLCQINGATGSKARAAMILAKGAKGVTTAGARLSPQVSRVARIAEFLGIPCRCHVAPSKKPTDQEVDAAAHGAVLVRHKVGYLSALKSKAKKDAEARGWVYLPFGMESQEYFDATAEQVANLPWGKFKRIVVPVGSGMSLAGIVRGIVGGSLGESPNRRLIHGAPLDQPLEIVGVCVGGDPHKRIAEWAPEALDPQKLPDGLTVTLIPPDRPYEEPAKEDWWGVRLDPFYEAKAAPHVRPGDLLWVVSVRSTPALQATRATIPAAILGPVPEKRPRWVAGDSLDAPRLLKLDGGQAKKPAPVETFDLVFSCPPYGDLEKYSDDPQDLSAMPADGFDAVYAAIIGKAVALLKPDRFAVFVVGDYRDAKGFYRNFVSKTIAAFEKAGAALYNEAILVTSVGTLPLRVGAQFAKYRKLGKTHQNVLVFFKGDPRRIPETHGRVEVADVPTNPEAAEAADPEEA